MNGHRIPVIVVVTLAVLVIGGAAAIAFLAFTQTPIPDQLDRLVSTALGALGAILATTRASDDPPTPVVGADGGPVETVDVADPPASKSRK